ncbi:MAG: hypothetical protein RLZZ168_2042, partial [Cyanobacteriota bacterium]
MQAHHRGDVAAELEIGGLAAPQRIAQDLLNRVAPEGKLQLGRQHLEAGQGFLQGPLTALQPEGHLIALAE